MYNENQKLYFGEKVYQFYTSMKTLPVLPKEVDWINPLLEKETQSVVQKFFTKYYSDYQPRLFWFGINPGRFGSGLTGIGFTDPVNLTQYCGIEHQLPQQQELSSQFIYEVIDQFDSVDDFYQQHYITATCPLGLIKSGKNFNYYDDKIIKNTLIPFITTSIDTQYHIGALPHAAICIGAGDNFAFLQQLNETHQWFKKIISLPHPRWIMQYRRKSKEEYIKIYVDTLQSLC